MNKACAALLLIFMLTSCQRVPNQIEPQIQYAAHQSFLQNLTPPFPPLTPIERSKLWGQEYAVGISFAQDLDFYRSITALKRANYMIGDEDIQRKSEIQYYIVLNYFLGGRYQDVIDTFETSELSHVGENFPAYRDLLIILYESFNHTDNPDKSKFTLELIEQTDPKLANKLKAHAMIVKADFSHLTASNSNDFAKEFSGVINGYKSYEKSIPKAQIFNAFLPGAGYLYVGQKQSALTAFLLNGLFIAAAAHFFSQGQLAAGIITTSFEAGWYFGGIYGAGESAKLYNERLYENNAGVYLRNKKLFPIMMLQHAF